MIEEYKNIKLKIEELSTLLGFFKQKSIKKILFDDIQKMESLYLIVKDDFGNLQEEYRNFEKDSIYNLEQQEKQYKELENNRDFLEKKYENLETIHTEEIEKNKLVFNELNSNFGNLQEEYKNFKNQISDFENKHKDLVLKNQLISKLLSSCPNNQGLSKYKKILYEDFFEFANNEGSLSNEAEAIHKLQLIEKELELTTVYPELYKKNLIVIGGGFSVGKSTFINSFLEDINLPKDMTPTTAIPTYIMHNETKQFIACNHNGGIVDLYELDDNFHSKLSHDFIKSFEFNLNKIMPFIVIGTSIDKFQNLCFLDTPGHNPAKSGHTKEDKNNAKDSLDSCETILWLISALGGTISHSDIEFLRELKELENKNLYFIVNPKGVVISQMRNIIKEIEETLECYGIDYIGISVYDPNKKKEIQYKKKSLLEFLENINIESYTQNNLIKKLYEVYIMYKKAILKDIKKKEFIISNLNSLSLDLLQSGFDDLSNPAYQRLDKIKGFYSTGLQEKNLVDLEIVILKLKKAIDEVFGKESFIEVEKIEKDNIELNYDLSIDNGFFEDENNDNKMRMKEKEN